MRELSIIIPAAGLGKRMKSYGPKALLWLGVESLIARQIRLLTQTFPHAEILVVGGFEANRLKRVLPPHVRLIYNTDFSDTNVAHSIGLAMAVARSRKVLVVYGDLVFDKNTISGFADCDKSTILVDNGQLRPNEVGINIVDNKAMYFSYGLPTKWAQMIMLEGLEKHLFQQFAMHWNKCRYFSYEILNLVLENENASLSCLSPAQINIAEVDSSRDMEKAQLIAAKGD